MEKTQNMKSVGTHSFEKYLLSPYNVIGIGMFKFFGENRAANLASSYLFVLILFLINPD